MGVSVAASVGAVDSLGWPEDSDALGEELAAGVGSSSLSWETTAIAMITAAVPATAPPTA